MATEFGTLEMHMAQVEEMLSPRDMFRVMAIVGIQAETDMLEAAAAAVGPDLKFSGWPRLGKLKAIVTVTGPSFKVVPIPYGGWIVADKGRRPGSRAPSRGGTRSPVILKTPWGPRTYSKGKPLRIGASPGKNALTHGKLLVRLRSPERIERQIQIRLGRIYGRVA